MSKDFDEIRSYLRAVVTVRKQCTPVHNKDWKYCCWEEVILRHGIPFGPAVKRLGKNIRRGRMKECFSNSYMARALVGDKVTYCEGIAVPLIPVTHAWLVSRNGRVHDPTWKPEEKNVPYFGIGFDFGFVMAQFDLWRACGIFAQWGPFAVHILKHGFPKGAITIGREVE